MPDAETGMGQPWLYGQMGEWDAGKQHYGKGPEGQNFDSKNNIF